MHHKHVITAGDTQIRIENHPEWGVVLALKAGDGPEVEAQVAKTVAFAIKRAIEGVAYDADEVTDW